MGTLCLTACAPGAAALCAALAGLTAALIAPDSASLKLVSELVAPGLNLLAIFGLILPALLIGRARRKL